MNEPNSNPGTDAPPQAGSGAATEPRGEAAWTIDDYRRVYAIALANNEILLNEAKRLASMLQASTVVETALVRRLGGDVSMKRNELDIAGRKWELRAERKDRTYRLFTARRSRTLIQKARV